MRTAALVYEFPSFSQTFVRNQIEGLIQLGLDVRIYADSADHVAEANAERGGVDLMDRVTYFGLPFRQLRESVGNWRRRFTSPVDATPRSSERRGPGLRLRLEARAFEENRFDVVHAHFGPNGVRAVRLRDMRALSGPVLTSFYGYDVGRQGTRAGYARLFSEGERFIALSEHMRKALIDLGCPADRVTVLRLGVDLDRFSATPRTNGSRLEVISIARFVPKKGLVHGLRAIAELSRRGVSVHYTLVGHGPLRATLERTARELGIESMVRFAGPQPQSVIAGMLQHSDVLLAPSVTAVDGDAEGTPVAILEAQASGRPVVATVHAGIPEIVDDGRSGFLVSEGNVHDIADRLARLAESPSLRVSMGEAGRAIMTERHDIRILNRELLQIYRELAG